MSQEMADQLSIPIIILFSYKVIEYLHLTNFVEEIEVMSFLFIRKEAVV